MFSLQDRLQLDISGNDSVAMIPGHLFSPQLIEYKGNIADSEEFIVYIFKGDPLTQKENKKLWVCKFLKDNDQVCDEMYDGTKNFFAHLRTHTGQKPFKCTI